MYSNRRKSIGIALEKNSFSGKIANHGLAFFIALVLIVSVSVGAAFAQSSVRPPDNATENAAPVDGNVPGNALGNSDVSNAWRDIKQGVEGNVSIPDSKAGVLVQTAGESYRLTRNGPLFSYLGLAMLGTLIALALFFALRGRIRVEHGMSGKKIKRFSTFERMGHWLMAISFIILGISGLNVTFGKSVVMPIIGKDAFGPLSLFLKTTHHYVAFAFMLGLAIAFISWVLHNIPNRHDLVWLLKGGGLFSKGVHPPAKKFNAGQKIIFWITMIGGLSLSLSGWQLLYPFEHSYFADTFAMMGKIGLDIPAIVGMASPPYSAIQEQQFATIWHVIMAVFMICVIFAHIYIGSVGMEGAFDAMGSGEVDENWAKEHHSLWVEEEQAKMGAVPAVAVASAAVAPSVSKTAAGSVEEALTIAEPIAAPVEAVKAAPRTAAKGKHAAKAKTAKDDLKLIKGIGPQNERRLNSIGVHFFSEIAKWTAKEQADIGNRLEFPGRIEREEWVKQARILAKKSGGK